MSSNPESRWDPGSTDPMADRAKGGDRAAFGQLYERVAPAVHAYAALRLGWRWRDPEDLVSEVWMRAWARISGYDPTRSFRAWVFGIAKNVVREVQRGTFSRSGVQDAHESSGGPGLLEIPEDATSVSRRVARDESLRKLIEWAREDLSDYEKEVLVLVGLQGRALDEVAQFLGRQKNAVTQCWSRLRRRAREYQTPDGLFDPSVAAQGERA